MIYIIKIYYSGVKLNRKVTKTLAPSKITHKLILLIAKGVRFRLQNYKIACVTECAFVLIDSFERLCLILIFKKTNLAI